MGFLQHAYKSTLFASMLLAAFAINLDFTLESVPQLFITFSSYKGDTTKLLVVVDTGSRFTWGKSELQEKALLSTSFSEEQCDDFAADWEEYSFSRVVGAKNKATSSSTAITSDGGWSRSSSDDRREKESHLHGHSGRNFYDQDFVLQLELKDQKVKVVRRGRSLLDHPRKKKRERRGRRRRARGDTLKSRPVTLAYYKRIERWETHIWGTSKGKQIYVGSCSNEEAGARIYDRAYIKFRGQNCPNFPYSDYVHEIPQWINLPDKEFITMLRQMSRGKSLIWFTPDLLGGWTRDSTGAYGTQEEGARTYDQAVIRFFGKAKALNFTYEDYTDEMPQWITLSREEFISNIRNSARADKRKLKVHTA
ncbi:hypothetical protein SELMODRAFT_414339 [Selaginella moellendorffii]|uniref:AP2/ERF domain-containing protein n=1 Tax=Selaginella moellendorffii TaxID=88036 RepID=D8RSE8_SELML|nr:hypothetical protein SELMODRAFT_414339 [Selaginella moellendorffii]